MFSNRERENPPPPLHVVLGTTENGERIILDLSRGKTLLFPSAPDSDFRRLAVAIYSTISKRKQGDIYVVGLSESETPSLFQVPQKINPASREFGGLIIELSGLMEQRNYGRELGKLKLLVIEEFHKVFPKHIAPDPSLLYNFEWLIRTCPDTLYTILQIPNPDNPNQKFPFENHSYNNVYNRYLNILYLIQVILFRVDSNHLGIATPTRPLTYQFSPIFTFSSEPVFR